MDGVVLSSLALCPHVVSALLAATFQRPREASDVCDSYSACLFICFALSRDTSMSRTAHPQENLNMGVEVQYAGLDLPSHVLT